MTESRESYRFESLLRSRIPALEIKEADYRALSKARDSLLGAIDIEDNFDSLIENFFEFEQEHLRIAVRRTVGGAFVHHSIRQDRLVLARRLTNVLATARAFVDQVDRTFKYQFPESREVLQVECHTQYDARFGYRVMEELRHVVTHKGRGLQRLYYPHSSRERGVEVRVIAILSSEDLKPLKLKPTVLDELRRKGPRPIGALLRDYLEGLGAIHARARALSEPSFVEAVEVFRAWIKTGRDRWGKTQPGFGASCRRSSDVVGHGKRREPDFQVVESFLDVCVAARQKTYRLKNLRRVFVSSQQDENDE